MLRQTCAKATICKLDEEVGKSEEFTQWTEYETVDDIAVKEQENRACSEQYKFVLEFREL